MVDIPAVIYLLKVNNGNTKTMCEICCKIWDSAQEAEQA